MIISAVIILYNPEDEVFENIDSYGDGVEKIFVVDNSEVYNKKLIVMLLDLYGDKLVYVNNNGNLGIATALNIGVDLALNSNSDWVLTMDQDSRFVDFNIYKKCFMDSIGRDDYIGIATLNHTNNINSVSKITSLDCEYEKKEIVITSGNFIRLSIFNKIGRFDDSLFIDMVDYDFSHKMIINGYKIIQFKNLYFIHQLGEIHKRKNIFTRKIRHKIEHNPQRVYYMTRNRLYMSRKYKSFLPNEYNALKTINLLFIHETVKILLYENNKLKKLYAKLIGLIHYFNKKTGRYDLDPKK